MGKTSTFLNANKIDQDQPIRVTSPHLNARICEPDASSSERSRGRCWDLSGRADRWSSGIGFLEAATLAIRSQLQ